MSANSVAPDPLPQKTTSDQDPCRLRLTKHYSTHQIVSDISVGSEIHKDISFGWLIIQHIIRRQKTKIKQ